MPVPSAKPAVSYSTVYILYLLQPLHTSFALSGLVHLVSTPFRAGDGQKVSTGVKL